MPEVLRDTIVRLLTKHARSSDFAENEERARVYDAALSDLLAALDPIADALYYEPCKMCGDSRFIVDPEAPEPEPGKVYAVPPNATPKELGFVPCPKCADRARAVVSAELYLEAQTALRHAMRRAGYQPGRTSPLLDAVLEVGLTGPPIVPLRVWKGRLVLPDFLRFVDGHARLVVEIEGVDAVDYAGRGAEVVVGVVQEPVPDPDEREGETHECDPT